MLLDHRTWTMASINKKFILPKQVNILHLYFLKTLLDTPKLLTIFLSREFNNYCWTFFANSIAGFNPFSGGISQQSLPKILRAISSKASAFTSLGTLITYRIPFWSTEHLPSTGVLYWLICLIKVNSLAAKQLIQTEVSK